jgi:rhamnosyltransferase
MNLFAPSKQNTVVVYVTYNPDNRFSKSISIISGIFENIVIVDNNSANDVKLLINNDGINIIRNKENLGIARALNTGAEFAVSKGAKWLLMFDQDTIPREDILSVYCSVYLEYPEKERIGQIGVSYYQPRSISGSYKTVSTLITSGSLLSLDVYKTIGKFRDDFFIDSVDFEYSLRIKKNGYVNLISPEVAISHHLGNPKEKKYLFVTVRSSNHPPVRRYYMARNHAIISFNYFFNFPLWVLKKNYFFIVSLFQIILVDDQKLTKIRKTLSGLKDGIFIHHSEKN